MKNKQGPFKRFIDTAADDASIIGLAFVTLFCVALVPLFIGVVIAFVAHLLGMY